MGMAQRMELNSIFTKCGGQQTFEVCLTKNVKHTSNV